MSGFFTTSTPTSGGTGSGTVTSVSVGVPAAGITQTGSPITTSGTIALALANDLSAIEGLTGTGGWAKRTATDTWTIATPTAADVGADPTGSASTAVSNHVAASDPHVVYQLESEKGSLNGYAGLGAAGYVPTGNLGSGTANSTTFLRGDQSWAAPTASAAWGSITGTLSTQTDLQNALNAKSDTSHTHSYQPVDADLTAIAALIGTGGYAKRTAADTWSIATPTAADVGADSTGTAAAAVAAHVAAADPHTVYALDTDLSSHVAAADPHTVYQKESEKAAANGYASLGANTIVPTAQLGSGAASGSVFLRGDQTWAAPGGGSAVGVLSDLQMSILQSDGTLNAALGVQTWAGTNKTAQDVFTVVANSTYRVRGRWYVNTGATTHTTAMAWALATATVTDFQYQVMLWSAALNGIATVQSTVHASGVASKVMNATSTAVYTIIQFEGIMVIGTGGTVTPQINFSANPTGTNLMKRGSWISFERLGADTVTVVGGWA